MEMASVCEMRQTGVEWCEESQTNEPVMKRVTLRGVSSQTLKNFRNCQNMGLPLICDGDGHQSNVPCRCDSKACESCCKRQGKRVKGRYSKPIKASLANRHRGYSLKLVTVTRAIPEGFWWLRVSG
jgi:hypothetical protein